MNPRRRRIVITVLALFFPVVLFALGQFGGLRVNLTPSFPLGLWRVEALRRPVGVGDVVFICPPRTTEFAIALGRGYLRPGPCTDGLSPLIKQVVAVAGQTIRIAGNVVVDGKPRARSDVHHVDAAGRPLAAWPGGVVAAGQVFLHSDFVGSYDSRYFGPIPESGVLGLAVPVLTFGG